MRVGNRIVPLPIFFCFVVIATSTFAWSVSAEGGTSFDNIALELDYRRAPAANFPELVALLEGSLEGEGLEFVSIPENLPGRVRGIPGVATFDYDNDGDLDLYVTQGPGRAASLYSNSFETTERIGSKMSVLLPVFKCS